MRILMVGALSMQYVRENWVEPLALLHDCAFVDVLPILSGSRSTAFLEQYLYDTLRADSYDFLFFYPDAINRYFSDEFFQDVRAAGLPIVAFYADDEPERWYQMNKPFDHRFDVIATHSLNGFQRRQAEGRAGNCLHLPWGYNDAIFDWIPDLPKRFDLVHFGKAMMQEADNKVFYQEFQIRQAMLVDLYQLCQAHGLTFRVFGAGWEQHPVLKACAGGRVSTEEMVRVYSQSRLVFNPGFSNDGTLTGYQTKLRHFEVAGCGCCQLVNSNPELATLFKEDEEILFFADFEALKDKVLRYLAQEPERNRIAAAAHQRARNEHTSRHRLEKLFDHARQKTERKLLTCISERPVIIPVPVRDAEDARQHLSQIQAGDARMDLPETAFVHFVLSADEPGNAFTDYSALPRSLLRSNTGLVAVQTYLEIAYLDVNPITRSAAYMKGLVLDHQISIRSLEPWLLGYVERFILSLRDEDVLYPLINLLVPVKHLSALARCYLAGDVAGFKALPLVRSHRLVNDLKVPRSMVPASECVPEYANKLRECLESWRRAEERILIYGVRGRMADNVLGLVRGVPDAPVIGLVDKGMVGQQVAGFPVYGREDIDRLRPTIILIAAEFSGPEIHRSIRTHSCSCLILPLYDLGHPSWAFAAPAGRAGERARALQA